MRDTQFFTPLTVGDAPKESHLLVTGNSSQSNKDELLGDNGAQQAPSTPEGEGPKAEALWTKNKMLGAKALRTQNKKAWTEPPRTQTWEAVRPASGYLSEGGKGGLI